MSLLVAVVPTSIRFVIHKRQKGKPLNSYQANRKYKQLATNEVKVITYVNNGRTMEEKSELSVRLAHHLHKASWQKTN